MRRPKRRYLIFKVSGYLLNTKDVSNLLLTSLLKCYGIKGYTEALPHLVKFDEAKQAGILMCAHKGVVLIRSSLALTSSFKGRRIRLETVKVTGTLRKALRILCSLQ